MEALLGAEGMLKDVGRLRKGLVHIAAPQLGIEREVGRLAPLEMLEVGEAAGGLELIVHEDLRGHRLDLVIDRGQFLVFRNDFLRRRLGDVGIGGDHDRHRLADEADLVDRQDRLVVEGRPVIGVGDDFANVVGGYDAIDARNLLRRAGVDRLDAAMRDRAAKDFPMQHAGQTHRVSVFGAPADLVARFETGQRTADLPARGGCGCRWHCRLLRKYSVSRRPPCESTVRRHSIIDPYSRGRRKRLASGPIPKFVSTRGTFRYELRNQRSTSNFMIPVRF